MLEYEPLYRHTSWRVGGPARYFYRPADMSDLQCFMRECPTSLPLFWLGLGSNILVRDAGLNATVIATRGCLDTLQQIDTDILEAGAGTSCAVLARYAAKAGLAGVEFLATIPGTLGGALKMNAGAFGAEIWQQVMSVQTIDRIGRLHTRLPDAFHIGYRHVVGAENEWFSSARLRLQAAPVEEINTRMQSLLARRRQTQPTGKACAGSVFKNPVGDFAGRLIETAGLKGLHCGFAVVAEKHANFIINEGAARAIDIETLILKVQQRVQKVHGVLLEPEVQIIGDAHSNMH